MVEEETEECKEGREKVGGRRKCGRKGRSCRRKGVEKEQEKRKSFRQEGEM